MSGVPRGSSLDAAWVLGRVAAGVGTGRGLSSTRLASADARAALAIAPIPAEGARVPRARVESALRRGGRQRRVTAVATRVVAALRVPQLRQDPVVEQAMRTEALALLGVLDAISVSIDHLAEALTEAFTAHPDYQIITSFPGLADISGAIVLAEIGDDPTRFCTGRALQAFAGSAPVTRASGKSTTVTRRRTKNSRLAAIGYCWAFSAASRPGPAREHYQARRARGDAHPAALRHLFNRMLGQLHHCLYARQRYDPIVAYPHATLARRSRLDTNRTSEVSSVPWLCGSRRRWAGDRGGLHHLPES